MPLTKQEAQELADLEELDRLEAEEAASVSVEPSNLKKAAQSAISPFKRAFGKFRKGAEKIGEFGHKEVPGVQDINLFLRTFVDPVTEKLRAGEPLPFLAPKPSEILPETVAGLSALVLPEIVGGLSSLAAGRSAIKAGKRAIKGASEFAADQSALKARAIEKPTFQRQDVVGTGESQKFSKLQEIAKATIEENKARIKLAGLRKEAEQITLNKPVPDELTAEIQRAEGQMLDAQRRRFVAESGATKSKLRPITEKVPGFPAVKESPGLPEKPPAPQITGSTGVVAKSIETPKNVPKGYQFVINPNRFPEKDALSAIGELAESPEFSKRVISQRRGVVPQAETLKGAKTLMKSGRITAEEIGDLKPGELPKVKAPLPNIVAAAHQFEQDAAVGVRQTLDALDAGKINDQQALEAINRYTQTIIGAEGIISEQGRALNILRSKNPSAQAIARGAQIALKEMLDDAVKSNPTRAIQFMREISSLPAESFAARRLASLKFLGPRNKAIAMLYELRPAMLLTAPITFARNSVGNIAAITSNIIERVIAPSADIARVGFGKLTGRQVSRQRFLGEANANLFGMWKGMHDAAKLSLEALRREGPIIAATVADIPRQPAIPGVVGKIVRIPFRILSSTDIFFKSLLASGELSASAFRIAAKEGLTGSARGLRVSELLKNPTREMFNEAQRISKIFTFQAPLGKIAKPINQLITAVPGGRILVPFFHTPAKLAEFVFERIPGTALFKIGHGEAAITDAVARNIVGYSAIQSMSLLERAHEGLLTGVGPKDKKEREDLYATGWRPYSLHSGEGYYGFQGFEPLSSMLRFIADYAQESRENPGKADAKKMYAAVKIGARGFFDQPFLKSISQVLDIMEGREKTAMNLLNATVASFVPTGIASIARSTDRTIRDPETLLETVKTRIPGLSKTVAPRLDRFGRPLERTSSLSGLADFPPKPDILQSELYRLGLSREVPQSPESIRGVQLSKSQKREFVKSTGPLIKRALAPVILSKSFPSIGRKQQEQVISKIVNFARNPAAKITSGTLELQELGIPQESIGNQLKFLIGYVADQDEYKDKTPEEKRMIVNAILLKARGQK